MSMILVLCQASDAQLRDFLRVPELERLQAFLDSEPERTDLDKAWQGLHWLLTGSDWGGQEPLCYLVAGGHQIGEVSLTYGPARGLFSQEVAAFDAALARLSPETLAARYDPEALMAADIRRSGIERPRIIGGTCWNTMPSSGALWG